MRIAMFAMLMAACDVQPQQTESVPAIDTGMSMLAPPMRPRLHYTCGDPVCQGYRGPFPGVPSCRTYTEGDRCPRWAIGRTCDPMDGCNALLECRRDPDPGPCPISLAEHKKEIDYLDHAEQQAMYQELMGFKLATWRYNWDSEEVTPHLGFIIDDVLPSPAVAQSGERVDLYGYTTMTVAAVQAQDRRIAALEKELAELKALLKAQAK